MSIDFTKVANIVQNRWSHGRLAYESGEVCLLGAIQVASGVSVDDLLSTPDEYYENEAAMEAASVLNPLVEKLYPERYRESDSPVFAIWRFNDHRDTTKADVLAVLDEAAARA